MDVDEPGPGGRSPSVASQIQTVGPGRRSTRWQNNKKTDSSKGEKSEKTSAISENIDAEGRLPGSREGLGAFPPGSDWARTMLALKIKGEEGTPAHMYSNTYH